MEKRMGRAVVLGSGYTGLLAAKVLSTHFDEVLVIERDSESEAKRVTPRNGAPQGGYAHFLIPLGLDAVTKIFPQFTRQLVLNGAREVDLFADIRLVVDGVCGPRFKSDRTVYLMGRPLIDKTIRDLVKECPNIAFQYETEAKGLIYNNEAQKISGVILKDRKNLQVTNLPGDLIIDATGPFSRCSEWLEEIGLKKPPVEELQIDYNQIACRARFKEDFNPDWMYTIFRKSGFKKGGYFMRIEDDEDGKPQWHFAVVTHFGEALEKSKEDFDRLSSQLEDRQFGEAAKNAMTLTEIGQYRVPKIRRKSFSKIEASLQGLVAIGDAQCVWAPHTGLGLAMGAMEVLALSDALVHEQAKNVSAGYFKRSEKIIDAFWKRSIKVPPLIESSQLPRWNQFLAWYKNKLAQYSFSDPRLWKERVSIVLSEKSTASLLRPSIVLRILLHMLRGEK
jgi:2-polyprenyl-6-methoxyphenol hydroxylase-like FAD-dependent oxidoreductase